VVEAVRVLLVLQAQPAEAMVVLVLPLLFLDLLLLTPVAAVVAHSQERVEQVAQEVVVMAEHLLQDQMVILILAVVAVVVGMVDQLAEMVDRVL
jgi:predicted permease